MSAFQNFKRSVIGIIGLFFLAHNLRVWEIATDSTPSAHWGFGGEVHGLRSRGRGSGRSGDTRYFRNAEKESVRNP